MDKITNLVGKRVQTIFLLFWNFSYINLHSLFFYYFLLIFHLWFHHCCIWFFFDIFDFNSMWSHFFFVSVIQLFLFLFLDAIYQSIFKFSLWLYHSTLNFIFIHKYSIFYSLFWGSRVSKILFIFVQRFLFHFLSNEIFNNDWVSILFIDLFILIFVIIFHAHLWILLVWYLFWSSEILHSICLHIFLLCLHFDIDDHWKFSLKLFYW